MHDFKSIIGTGLKRTPDSLLIINRFPNQPNVTLVVDETEGVNLGVLTHYRLTAVFTAPSTGLFSFALSSSGPASLFLSPDLKHPSSATLVASVTGGSGYRQWNTNNGQVGPEQLLVEGEQYYIEAIGTGDYVTVGAMLGRALFNHRDTIAAIDEVQVRHLVITNV